MTQLVTGYRKKPYWIYVAACLLLLAPLGNLLIGLYSLKVPGWWHPKVWVYAWTFVTPFRKALMFSLMGSGIGIFYARRSTWLLCLLSMALVSGDTIYQSYLSREVHSQAYFLGAMLITTLAAIVIIMGENFRRPYINPRLRWWESSHRMKTQLPIKLEGIPRPAFLLDISKTGALIEWKESDLYCLLSGKTILHLPQGPAIECEVIRRTAHGYGLHFLNLNIKTRWQLRNWLHVLRKNPQSFTLPMPTESLPKSDQSDAESEQNRKKAA